MAKLIRGQYPAPLNQLNPDTLARPGIEALHELLPRERIAEDYRARYWYRAPKMTRATGIAAYRVCFGLLTLAAVATQLVDIASRGVFDPLHYFSYFTIESNLLAAVLFLILAARRGERTARMDLIRGGAVVYMTVTGVVFNVLLANSNVDTAIPWVNDVVHSTMPIVVVADWLLDPPRRRPRSRQGLAWIGYPAVWLVYTLVKAPSSASTHTRSSIRPTADTEPWRSIAWRSWS